MTTSTSLNLLTPYTARNRFVALLEIIQNKKVISFCLLFSVFLHVLFFVRFGGLQSNHNVDMPISRSIDIVLNKYIPEKPPEVKKKIKPVKKKIVEKPKPIEKKVVKPIEPIPVVEEEIVEEVVEEPIEEQKVAQAQPLNTPPDPSILNRKKRLYLDSVAAHLDKHKFYPRSARRRHIEGSVQVSFDLLEDGNILNLKIFSGHSALQKATSESITSALPMPPRPESLLALNTMKIEYSMQFSLKD